jgi:UDP-N-acetylglucosamine 1-carboxyvinyltransferase
MGELRRMGARIDIGDARHATIHGRTPLKGADVDISDLRAGASLILAALAANGVSTIHGAHHVHRGYENIEGKFAGLGARISRLAEGNDTTNP